MNITRGSRLFHINFFLRYTKQDLESLVKKCLGALDKIEDEIDYLRVNDGMFDGFVMRDTRRTLTELNQSLKKTISNLKSGLVSGWSKVTSNYEKVRHLANMFVNSGTEYSNLPKEDQILANIANGVIYVSDEM